MVRLWKRSKEPSKERGATGPVVKAPRGFHPSSGGEQCRGTMKISLDPLGNRLGAYLVTLFSREVFVPGSRPHHPSPRPFFSCSHSRDIEGKIGRLWGEIFGLLSCFGGSWLMRVVGSGFSGDGG